MDITLLSQLTTYLVFGGLGYLLGRGLSVPAKVVHWVLWLVLLELADNILQFQLVNIFGFIIYAQYALQALVAGIILNFVVRASRPETPKAVPAGATKSWAGGNCD